MEDTQEVSMGPQQIVIADRGWVWVGKTRREGDTVVIDEARTVRRWGTTRGLGQLANDGPTETTILDPVGRLIVPAKAVIGIIACNAVW